MAAFDGGGAASGVAAATLRRQALLGSWEGDLLIGGNLNSPRFF